jgi:tetratricopeptide (TPR) repeat protein
MKRFFSTIVFVASFAALTHAQTTYREWMELADKDLQAGKYSTAMASYTKAIQLSAANSDAFMGRAIAKTKNGDDEGAAIDFTNVIRAQPTNAKAYALRSDTKARRSDFQAALFDINQALKYSPKEIAFLEQRSKISAKMGLVAQAQADLDEMEKIKKEPVADNSEPITEPIATTPAASEPVAVVPPVKSTRRERTDEQSGREDEEEVAIVKTGAPKIEQRKEQRKADLKIEEKSANNFNEPEVPVKKETPKPVAKVEKPKEEPKPVVVKVEAPKEEPKPVVVKVEAPKEVPKPVVKVETPKEEPKPVAKVELPKEEPKPIVKVETPKVEPIVSIEKPKEEPKPIVKVETPKPANDNEIIVVDGIKQFKNGTIIGAVELEPTGGASLQKKVEGGQPNADFRGNAQTNLQADKTNNQANPQTEKVQNDKKAVAAVFTPTPAKNAGSLASTAVAARPNSQKTNEQLSDKPALKPADLPVRPAAPRAPSGEIHRSMFLEARRMAHDHNHKGAIEQLTKLIAEDPSNSASFLNRAISKSVLEDFEGAMKDFDEALKISPDMAEIYYNRANVFFDTQRYKEAITGYTEALAKNKDYVQAYLNRALAKRAMGGVYDPCSDWKAAAALGSEKAKKMLDAFCDDAVGVSGR